MDNKFKLDQLFSNYDFIKKYCLNNVNDWNKFIIENCDELIDIAKYIDQIAYRYTFDENVPINGFVSFLKIITSYTDIMVKQIKKKNKIDPNFIKLFKLINSYANRIKQVHQNLVKEENNKDNKNSLILNDYQFEGKEFYDQIHSNGDVIQIALANYPAFWLKDRLLKKILKFFNFCFAVAFKLPFSLSSIYSSKSLGKYCFTAFKNSTVKYPFSIWHMVEIWFVATFLNGCVNIKIPVTSKTIYIPKQVRFRLDHKGNILDFDKMTKEEIDDYFNDKEEQERQNSPGLRHRNKETIECRYSFINSNTKIKESLDRIEKDKINDDNFKNLKYYTLRKKIEQKSELKHINQVEELNIYEPTNLLADKLKLKRNKNKIKKSHKYNGPKYLEKEDFKDVPLKSSLDHNSINNNNSIKKTYSNNDNDFKLNQDNQQNDKNIEINIDSKNNSNELIDYNPEKIIIVYCHGGGYVTQGPKSTEFFFLRKLVNELGGVPVLGVHYSLTVAYPIQLQEILDVYLYLLSKKEEVKEKIGFHPKKIILMGDSAGGYFAAILPIILNELNKKIGLNNQNLYPIPLPSSIVLEYPVLAMKTMSPSRTLTTLEPLIAFHPLLLVVSLYITNKASNGDYKIKNDLLKQIEDKNKHLFDSIEFKENIKEFEKYNNKDQKPWFCCSYPEFKSRAEYINSFYDNPFISPLSYKHFDELDSIDLYSLSGEFDFLMDDSIEFGNTWKGNKSIDLICNVLHGFFYFNNFSNECNESVALTIKRLREACNLI